VVCGQTLDARAVLTPRKTDAASAPQLYPLCQDFACKIAFEQGKDMSAAAFQRHLDWHARLARDQRALARLSRARTKADRQAAAVFDAIAARAGSGAPADLQLVVSSGHGRPRPLTQRRRRLYLAHLDAVIAAAQNPPEPVAPAAPSLAAPDQPAPIPPALDQPVGAAKSTLPGRLCGVCGGGCCPAGGTHAFQSEATIRRVMAANPDLDSAGLRALYLGHLPQRTIPGGCVFQARTGCGLPRSLRGDICNSYACQALQQLQNSLDAADPPPRKVVVLRRRQNQWKQDDLSLNNDIVSATVLTEAATKRLRPPTPEGWAMEPPGAEPADRQDGGE